MRLHPAEIERRIGDGGFPTPKREVTRDLISQAP